MSSAMLALSGLAGVVLAGVAWEAWRLGSARAPATPAVRLEGTAPAQTGQIPRVIWTYWAQQPCPAFVEACIQTWRNACPDHEVRVLDRAGAERWIPSDTWPQDFDQLPPFRQADWIRLALLARHGGIWIDGSSLLTAPLAWAHQLQTTHGAELSGFYIDRFTFAGHPAMVENWFFAARPGSRFIQDLLAAFEHALREGPEACIERLRAEGRLDDYAQGIEPNGRSYLLMHVLASQLLHEHPERYRLILQRAEDGPFAFHAALGWRKRHLYARLGWLPCPRPLPPLLKLRGPDRRVFEGYYLQRRWHARSALGRLWGPPKG